MRLVILGVFGAWSAYGVSHNNPSFGFIFGQVTRSTSKDLGQSMARQLLYHPPHLRTKMDFPRHQTFHKPPVPRHRLCIHNLWVELRILCRTLANHTRSNYGKKKGSPIGKDEVVVCFRMFLYRGLLAELRSDILRELAFSQLL